MASDGGGKVRNKRHFEANKPYNRRKSLMARVGDTVKDMLSPSWLVDLVSTVKRKTPPHSPSLPDQHLGNNQHFSVDGEVPVRREINRVREEAGEASLGNSFVPTMRTGNHPNQPSVNEGTAFTSSQLPFQGFKSFPQAMVNGDDLSENSEYSVSTSGCSSMIPHPDKKDYQRDILQINESKLHQFRPDMPVPSNKVAPAEANQLGKGLLDSEGSFLWSSCKPKTTSRNQPQPPAQAQRPAFNLSAFTMPSSPKDKSSIFGSSYLESPYYPGKTTYGGASAHRKNRLQASAPYQQSGVRKQVKAKPLSNTDMGGVTSSTARKILDSLEKMSTPLSDAKKIPASYKSFELDSPLSFTPSFSRRRKFGSTSRSSLEGPLSRGPPVNQINTPGVASRALNRSSMLSPSGSASIENPSTRSYSRPVQEIHEKVFSSQPDKEKKSQEEGGSHTGKMKRDRGSHYTSKRQEECEEIEIPNLPTNVTLPVFNMPKIDLGNSSSGGNRMTPNGSMENGPHPAFKFSSPIEKTGPQSLGNVSPVKFEFSAPIHVNKNVATGNSGPNFTFGVTTSTELKRKPLASFVAGENKSPDKSECSGGIKIASELKSGSVMDFFGKSANTVPEVDGVGIKPASTLKRGSVMDILGKATNGKSTGPESSVGLSDLFKKPVGSWECPTCLIQNKSEVTTCPACQTSKPAVPQSKSSSPQVTKVPGDNSLAAMFRKPVGTWECPTCMIQNKGEVSKCAACETPKPVEKLGQTMESNSSLAGLFKKPAGSWECPTCMIQNKPDTSKCAACETARPGAPPPTVKQDSGGSSLAAQFKKPAGSWECDTCMVVNKAEAHRCVACETPKPGAKPPTGFTSSSGFKFAAGGGFKFEDKASTDAAGSKTSGSGGFAMPSSVPSGGFKFTTSTSDESKNATAALGGGFKLTLPATSGDSQPPTGGFKFGGDSSQASNAVAAFKVTDSKDKSIDKPAVSGGFGFKESTATKPSGETSDIENKGNESDKPALIGGFKFGDKATASEKTVLSGAGGFKFNVGASTTGNKAATGDPSVDLTKDATSVNKPLSGGFSFESKTNNSDSKGSNVKTDVGGFSFPQASSETKTENSTSATGIFNQVVAPKSDSSKPSVGGFSFGQIPAKTDASQSSTVPSNTSSEATAGGFSFGLGEGKSAASKQTLGSSGIGQATAVQSKTDTKPGLGGFAFATSNTSGATDNSQGKQLSGNFAFDSKSEKAGSGVPAPSFSFGNNQQSETTATSSVSSGLFTFSANKDSSVPAFGSFSNQKSDSSSDTKSSSFQFGVGNANAVPSSSSSNSALFTFGNKPAGVNSNQPLGAAFGTQSALGTSTNKRGRNDTDGPGDAKKTAFSGNVSNNFTFGQSSAAAAPPNLTGNNTPFAFGQSNSTATSTAPTFNFPGGSQTSSSSTGANFSFGQNTPGSTPAFGGTPVVTTNVSSTFSTTPSFNFASSTPNQGGLFQFSANNQNVASTPGGSVSASAPFGFGQASQTAGATPAPAPAAAPNPGFNFSASAAPNFNFGGGNAPSIQFSASGGSIPGAAASGSNPFNANAAPRRTIKKAVRRRK